MCDSSISVLNISPSNCFVILDPSIEISTLCKITKIINYNDVINKRLNKTDDDIQDIYDGQYYKMFVNSLPPNEKNQYVTAIFNTDGASRFESSQNSRWPIQIQVNELPPQNRLKNIITCGMWFGKSKPDIKIKIFLEIFVNEMNIINKNEIKCVIKGETRMLKLYMLILCVDSVVNVVVDSRAPMQGLVQFNGYYSCSWCLHPGQWVDGCVRFPILHNRPINRQVVNIIKSGEQANTSGNIIQGVKYVTPLPYFNIIDGFVPDYLLLLLSRSSKTNN